MSRSRLVQELHQEVYGALHELFAQDSERTEPVVQSMSLFFWQQLEDWVHQIAHLQEPFTIALTGASGSGKSFIREILVDSLSDVSHVASFTQDNYYRDFEADFPHLPIHRFYDEIDLDDPAHIRFKKLGEDLAVIKQSAYGSRMAIPKLRFGTPTSKPAIIEQGIEMTVSPFIVTEGIHAFHDPDILPLYNLKIYVDIDEKTRRNRWLLRNQMENRGTTDNMWQTTVACLNSYILPTRTVADLVINNNAPQEQVADFFREVTSILAGVINTVWEARTREIA